jgi:serine protease
MSLLSRPLGRFILLAGFLAGAPVHVAAQPSGPHLSSLRANQAAALLPAGTTPLVAVLDTGFQAHHPALNAKLVAGYNVFTGGVDVGLDLLDLVLYTHGTAVASIISSNESLPNWPRGVFPAARILPVKICCRDDGHQTDSNLLRQGILYAAGIPNDMGHASPERARVINISFKLSQEYDPLIVDAIAQANGVGSVVVVALGEGAPQVSSYLSGLPGLVGVMVANSGSSRPLNHLPIAAIPAPGRDILTLMPSGTALLPVPSLGTVAGSSFATAVASAVAAMVIGANPNLSAADVVSILSSNSVYDAEGLDAVLAVQKADDLPLPSTGGGANDGVSTDAGGGGSLNFLLLWPLLGAIALRRRR